MERDTFLGMVDVGLSFFRSFSAVTPSPLDDTICRYLEFARNDLSFMRIVDRIFAADEIDAPTEVEVAALKASFERFRDNKPEPITADDFISTWLPIILSVLKVIRDRRKAQPPAVAA